MPGAGLLSLADGGAGCVGGRRRREHVECSGAFKVNGELTPPEDYAQALKKRLDPRPASDRVVFVTAEDAAAYTKLVEALEGARRAGAETLGMSDEPPLPGAP